MSVPEAKDTAGVSVGRDLASFPHVTLVKSQSVASASAAAVALPAPDQQQSCPQASGVFEALRRSRAIFSCLAFCAVYGFLSWGASPGAPFASAAVAIGDTSSGLTSTAKSAWAGLAAGFLHTLCGPDHLAALTPLTIGRNRFAASALGALWGFGHSTGQLILGLVFVVLKVGGEGGGGAQGTTSQALIKEQPWIQKHLSTIASGIAIGVGVLMLAAGLGLEVPFFS
ncbi:hypothetical protein GPECTOR_23g73 [Gonium pectorale]|uniref:Urease accessory protein UreH-like transmembrane domain-containing protein n=1 Tax=Gonium pectorale TaxID=33097 RepID=A0A150GHP2_GONPE|nr:hypothetical protein GPECTOR_23g73 [Gonium pectorale]|eukprot:KXZ49145.1 hypothetical protein GPECTOR_23g73 [Gonium pectorale]